MSLAVSPSVTRRLARPAHRGWPAQLAMVPQTLSVHQARTVGLGVKYACLVPPVLLVPSLIKLWNCRVCMDHSLQGCRPCVQCALLECKCTTCISLSMHVNVQVCFLHFDFKFLGSVLLLTRPQWWTVPLAHILLAIRASAHHVLPAMSAHPPLWIPGDYI